MKKKGVHKDFKWGFYCLDPYSGDKTFELKGVSTKEVDKLFKIALKKFR